MQFESTKFPGRGLRLAYCLNLHGAEDLGDALQGMREFTLPLKQRLSPERSFGVGMYLPGAVAGELARPEGRGQLEELKEFLLEEQLDPFTFNAFPFGGFHRAGLKREVFEPTWCEQGRLDYTLAVASVASELNSERGGHISISTHPGRFGPWEEGELELATDHFGSCLRGLAALAERGGPPIRLSIEAEPRAAAGDTAQVNALLVHLRDSLAPSLGEDLLKTHLGACLDACHSAVEFEEPAEALELASVLPLGKLQYSSAISLPRPGQSEAARAALLGLDEPRYLHQTTGRKGDRHLRLNDLPELRAACAAADSEWLQCEEWRTHFHVPVDLERLRESGLFTTREHAVAILGKLLGEPTSWGSGELHVEIETYTWEILPGAARGQGDLIAGLEREYSHVLAQLDSAGWKQA